MTKTTGNRELGANVFELSNHLGNVLATVSDRKLAIEDGSTGNVDYYTADVSSYSDYYPFGMQMVNRASSTENYRHGFNGMEKDDEMYGAAGSSYDFGARLYDSRLGRWNSRDPFAAQYAKLSDYHFAGNCPILYVDPDGKRIKIGYKNTNTGTYETVLYKPGDAPPNGATQFVIDAFESLNYMHENGGASNAQLIDDVANDDYFEIQLEENNSFDPNATLYSRDQVLYYNPYSGLIVDQTGSDGHNRQSPSISLIHELDHANDHRLLLQAYDKAVESGNKDEIQRAIDAFEDYWNDPEEKHENKTVKGPETTAAKNTGQGIRTQYGEEVGVFKAKGPNSTEVATPTKREQRQIDRSNATIAKTHKIAAKKKMKAEEKRKNGN